MIVSLSLYIYIYKNTNTHLKTSMSPKKGPFQERIIFQALFFRGHSFALGVILELPAPRLWACPFTPVTMRFWNWRPWPVRGRKKTLLLSGRFGNYGIGQVPLKSQRVTVFGVVFAKQSRKVPPSREVLGGKMSRSSPLIWQKSHASSPILSGEVNALRHHLVMFLQFAKIPATENSEIFRFRLEQSFEKLGLNWIYPPPQPHPPFFPHRIRWPPWQKWNSNFTKVLGFNPAPGWGWSSLEFGVWGVKLELVGAVGWVGWVSWAWVGGLGLGLRLFGWCASNKKPSVTNMDDKKVIKTKGSSASRNPLLQYWHFWNSVPKSHQKVSSFFMGSHLILGKGCFSFFSSCHISNKPSTFVWYEGFPIQLSGG